MFSKASSKVCNLLRVPEIPTTSEWSASKFTKCSPLCLFSINTTQFSHIQKHHHFHKWNFSVYWPWGSLRFPSMKYCNCSVTFRPPSKNTMNQFKHYLNVINVPHLFVEAFDVLRNSLVEWLDSDTKQSCNRINLSSGEKIPFRKVCRSGTFMRRRNCC